MFYKKRSNSFRQKYHYYSRCWDGVDSGLPDFRGKRFLYPPLNRIPFEEMANPQRPKTMFDLLGFLWTST